MMYALLVLAQAEGEKPAQEPDPFLKMLPMLALMMLAFYFLLIRPQRRREREQREMLFKTLKKNDEVLTSGGIIGIVANIKDDNEVTLKLDESSNVRIRILRNSIIRILTPKDQGSPAATDAVKAGPPPAK
jgi:preprotein translocase subunit YajC